MIIEIKYKKLICDIGKRVYEKGFVAANAGNISVRIDDNEFLITPANVSKGVMTPEMIIKVDGEGNVIEGDFKPTSEMKMHLLVYHERPEAHAILHAHPPYATAFAIAGLPLGHDYQGVLLENHGALTWGKNLEHAYNLMESLEFTAKINWISSQLKEDRELSLSERDLDLIVDRVTTSVLNALNK